MKFEVRYLIYVDDAKELRRDTLIELSQRLKDANEWLSQALTTCEEKEDEKTKAILFEILNILENLKKEFEVKTEDLESLDTKTMVRNMKECIQLFKKIDPKIRLTEKIIMLETAMVLINSSIRWLHDAQSIIKDRKKASNMNSLLVEFQRIAKEFQERFPTFLGYRIKTEGDRQGVWIYVVDPPPIQPKDSPDILKALESEVRKLLEWELQKCGEDLSVCITASKQGSDRMISCEIDELY